MTTMKNRWNLEEAGHRFEVVARLAVEQGPQVVLRDGQPVVMVVRAPGGSTQATRRIPILELFEPVRGLDLLPERDRGLEHRASSRPLLDANSAAAVNRTTPTSLD